MKQFFNQTDNGKSNVQDFLYCPHCGNKLTNKNKNVCPRCGFTHYKNPLPGVSVLISSNENKVLVGKRKYKPEGWCLPCGFIETNENYLTAAHREVKEETGLEITLDSIINVVSNIIHPEMETLVIVLHAKPAGGTQQPGDDIIELEWIDSSTIPYLAFDADRFIITEYFKGNLNKLEIDKRFVTSGKKDNSR